MNIKSLFIRWYFNQFAAYDDLHLNMQLVSEGSSYHREKSIGIHTNMVVSEYLTRCTNDVWTHDELLGAFACVFHDVGKPASKKTKHSPTRGTYFSFSGHASLSARLWEDWAVRNWKLLSDEFNFVPNDIYCVGWMVQNHNPLILNIETPNAIKKLSLGLYGSINNVDIFLNVLKSDNYGRITDNSETCLSRVEDFCNEFRHTYITTVTNYIKLIADERILYMPIAASGTGKSTLSHSEKLCSIIIDPDLLIFSLDDIRHDWYDKNDYANAFFKSEDDDAFDSKVQSKFAKSTKTNKPIFLDDINLSRKQRGIYINMAKQRGYYIVAILMPVALHTIIDRQQKRTDKTVPIDVVTDQYMSLDIPIIGDFDEIIVFPGNLIEK